MLPDLTTVRAAARRLTVKAHHDTRLSRARALTGVAVEEYSAGIADAPCGWDWLVAPRSGVRLSPEERGVAAQLGRSATALDESTAFYLVSTFYTLLVPEDVRVAGGVYFTPPTLAERLLDMVEETGVRWENARVVDPAAGGGAFMAPVARRMAAALARAGTPRDEILPHVQAHLTGVEIDPFLAWLGDVFLALTLRHLYGEADCPPQRMVVSADSLRAPLNWGGYDVVIGNPPYGRYRLDAELRRRYSRSLFGHANLYGLFTDLAVRLAADGGAIGYVTPASFLGGQYFQNLRALLAADAPPMALDFITDRSGVFDAVLQETVLVVLKRGADAGPVTVHRNQPGGLRDAGPAYLGRFTLPADASMPWLLPRNEGDIALLLASGRMPHRLADFGLAVSTGPLVWNRHKPQLVDGPGVCRYPIIWAESVLSSGEFRWSARRRNHAPYFQSQEKQDHLLTRNGVVLVQRTTAKEQSRRVIAAEMPEAFVHAHGAVVVENHVNMVYPVQPRIPLPLRAIAALLNSRVVDTLFRCINGSVAVSAFELQSLPLPPPAALTELTTLVDEGATAEEVDRFIRSAYEDAEMLIAA